MLEDQTEQTRFKTIQYLAEAHNSRVLVARDLKAAFQNVSHREMLYGIAQTDAHLAAVFSKWYTSTTEHRMHYDSACTKISANSGVDQGCPLSTCGFQLPLTLYSGQFWRSFAHITVQALNSLPTWTTVTCGSNHSTYHRQSMSPQQPPDQSTLLCSPPRHKHGKALARTPSHLSSKTRSHSHLSFLGGHLQIHGDVEPSPVVLGEQATIEKTTQRFQKIATTLADLNAEGLKVQAVNDLLTMYVGAASQHVLRMSFVLEQEAHNFDRQVMTFWSHLLQRDITSPLFSSTPQAWRTWSGLCSSTPRGCSMARVAVDYLTLMATTQSPDTDSLFSSTTQLRAQLAQLQTTLSQQMNKPTFLLKPLGAALRLKKHSKETSLHHPKKHPQAILQQPHRHAH